MQAQVREAAAVLSDGTPSCFYDRTNDLIYGCTEEGLVKTTRIAGPLDERHAGAIHALARTLSYAHRIRAIARDASEHPAASPVGHNRSVAPVGGCGCVDVAIGPTARRLDGPAICPHST
jgi:hypothetical protein